MRTRRCIIVPDLLQSTPCDFCSAQPVGGVVLQVEQGSCGIEGKLKLGQKDDFHLLQLVPVVRVVCHTEQGINGRMVDLLLKEYPWYMYYMYM